MHDNELLIIVKLQVLAFLVSTCNLSFVFSHSDIEFYFKMAYLGSVTIYTLFRTYFVYKNNKQLKNKENDNL
jgi:uncharacterized membrane protein